MTPAELENLVNNDSSVILAKQALQIATDAYDKAVSNRDQNYSAWQTAESEIKNLDKFWSAAKRKAKREEADNYKNAYYSFATIAATKKTELDNANAAFKIAKDAATNRINSLQTTSSAPEIAQQQTQALKIQKDSIVERLKANKKYIVWGLVAVVVIVTAIIVVKKYAK